MVHVALRKIEKELLIYFEGLPWQEALSLLNNETVTVTQLSYNVNSKEFYYLDILGEENSEGPHEVPHFVQEPISIGALLRQLHNADLYIIMLDGNGFSFMQYPRLGFHIVFHDYKADDKYKQVLNNLLSNSKVAEFIDEAIRVGKAYTDGIKSEIGDTPLMDFIIDRFHRFQDDQNRIWYEEQIKKEG